MNHRYAAVLALTLPLCAAAQTQNYPIGSTVADFTVTDTHGQVHHLYDYTAAGKLVILDFFFYNCGPCQTHAPSFSQLFQTYGCNDGDIICLSVNDGQDTDALAEQFAEDFGGDFSHPPAIGPVEGGALTNTFGVTAFPTFCLIGTDNTVKDDDIWPLSNGMASLVAAFPAGSQVQPMACAVGIREVDEALTTTVFPSPTVGPITLTLDLERTAAVTVNALDALGQSVFTTNLGTLAPGASNRTIDLSGLANGHYILHIHAGTSVPAVQRIVIAR